MLNACKKDEPNKIDEIENSVSSNPICLLTSLTDTFPTYDIKALYVEYDSVDRVNNYLTDFNAGLGYSEYENAFDATGKIVQQKLVYTSEGILTATGTYQFYYDQQGRIDSIYRGGFSEYVLIDYDAFDRITSYVVHEENRPRQVAYSMSYDANGNMERLSKTISNSTIRYEYAFKYDQFKNPFVLLTFPIRFFGFRDFLEFMNPYSRNNVVEMTSQTFDNGVAGPVEYYYYTYDYNANGYPTNVLVSSDVRSEYFVFNYDCR